MDFLTDTGTGWEEVELTDNELDLDLTETITGFREVTYSIGFYRDGAYDNARKVRTGVLRESVQALMRAGLVGLGQRSEVRSITENLETGWEQRAQFDITLHVLGSDSDAVTSIQSLEIQGEIETNSLVYPITIEVP